GRREELFGQLYFPLHTTLREAAARLRFFCAVLLTHLQKLIMRYPKSLYQTCHGTSGTLFVGEV
ncbi:hypothetical protein, partial [Fischerella sp. FACHB-380]|uniref:hypothetical protein n=1 Tax=Fischerella sp. FACHB-380 TaxID=2692799 RepID=UPI001A7ECABE